MTLMYDGRVANPGDKQAQNTMRMYKRRGLRGFVAYSVVSLAVVISILTLIYVGTEVPPPNAQPVDMTWIAWLTVMILVAYPGIHLGITALSHARRRITKKFDHMVGCGRIIKIPDLVDRSWRRVKAAYQDERGITVCEQVEAAVLYAMSSSTDVGAVLYSMEVGRDANEHVADGAWLENRARELLIHRQPHDAPASQAQPPQTE